MTGPGQWGLCRVTERLKVPLALLTTLIATAALALQLGLIIGRMMADGHSALAAVWRFLGFFTILTNCAVAGVAGAMALRPASRLAGPRVRLATAAAILLVGIVYSLALRSIWEPTGWQAVVDHALHDATPVLFLLAWTLSAHGDLSWRDAAWSALPPLAYCAYALARGAADGWYAYWFFDPNALGLGQMTTNFCLLLAAFLAAGVALVAVDRWRGRLRAAHGRDGGQALSPDVLSARDGR
ncbi:MAG: Pr6Pr family membrane protein [Alphaproteobacteria bacterium]|nr:Pr6Pr family membrane protein [Alphaproteobacteria bacterium]